jgi:hypothetical protein
MKKTKKQHYVPQCYLQHFTNEQSDHLFVYDKKTKKSWKSAISDVAEEGYFYDLSFPESLNANMLAFLQSRNTTVEQLKADQTIEKYLANTIEDMYARLLSSIITGFVRLTPWIENNCYFISKEEKQNFSYCLAVQLIRTRALRDSILDSADRLHQVLLDMGLPKEKAEQFTLTESQAGKIQGSMLIDKGNILKFAKLLNRLTWVLGINLTTQLLYTSDSPIAQKAHVKYPFLGMAGLASPGVELSIPISPNLVLIMIDGDYHKLYASQERKYWKMNLENVRHYNARCINQSHRFVFSRIDDFQFLMDIAKKDPQVLECGKQGVTLWGGKTYRARKR